MDLQLCRPFCEQRRFGEPIWCFVHPGTPLSVEAWGEFCISTVPDLQAGVLWAVEERPGHPLVVDLRRVWFCHLAGLRAAWCVRDLGRSAGTEIEVRESAAIRHVARLVAYENERALTLFALTKYDIGKPIQDLEISNRPIELANRKLREIAAGVLAHEPGGGGATLTRSG